MADAGSPDARKPSRGLAVVLALLGPMGIGQHYLGLTKRGVWWLVLSTLAFLALALALAPLGALLGYGKVLAVLVVALLLGWLASLLDLLRIPLARTRRVTALAVAGFWLGGFVMSMGLRAVVRGHVIEAFKMPSGSMQPTLLVGDHIMIDKVRSHRQPPRRGEAIVFAQPEHPEQDFIKRVIALPGDTLEVRSGHPWLNGSEVPHCLVGKATLPDSEPGCEGVLELEFLDASAYLVFFDGCRDSGKQGPYRIAPGELWVLGDNRGNSFDSPSWFGGRGGGVPFANVKGRGLFRWYSATEWSRYGTPIAEPLLPESMAGLRAGVARCLAGRGLSVVASPG
jgi:signal peptidase I